MQLPYERTPKKCWYQKVLGLRLLDVIELLFALCGLIFECEIFISHGGHA
jgi:hypothetical protein